MSDADWPNSSESSFKLKFHSCTGSTASPSPVEPTWYFITLQTLSRWAEPSWNRIRHVTHSFIRDRFIHRFPFIHASLSDDDDVAVERRRKKIVFQPWDYSRSAALIRNSSPSWSISDLRANNLSQRPKKTSPSKRRQTVSGKEISFVQQIRICNSRINWNFLIGAAAGQRELSDSQHDPTHPWYPLVTSERIKNSTECKMCTTGEGEWDGDNICGVAERKTAGREVRWKIFKLFKTFFSSLIFLSSPMVLVYLVISRHRWHIPAKMEFRCFSSIEAIAFFSHVIINHFNLLFPLELSALLSMQ